MQINITTTTAELGEMGLSSTSDLSAAVLARLDGDGVEHEGRSFSLSGFNVAASVVEGNSLDSDPTDLDSLIAFLTALRAQQGNMVVKHHPPSSRGQLVPASFVVSRIGVSASRLVTRGGNPVLLVG